MFDYFPSLKEYSSFCHLPLSKLIVNAWGDVSMCCHHPGEYQLGNIKNVQDIMEIWDNDLAKSVRKIHSTGKMHFHCESSPNCPYKTKKPTYYNFHTHKDFKYPTHLEIDLPDKHCNIGGEDPTKGNPACIMCSRRWTFPKNQVDITDEICQKSKSIIPYLSTFTVLGVAEPFWKNAVFDIFKKIEFSKHKNHICFQTNHNVTCFGEKTQKRFLNEVNSSILQFSIDAACAETYQKIRVLNAYDLVISNIKKWMKNKTDNHKVSIWNNINILNVSEMTAMVEVAADIKVDSMIMLPTHSINGRMQLEALLLNKSNESLFVENSDKAMERAKELGVNLHYPASWAASELVQLSY